MTRFVLLLLGSLLYLSGSATLLTEKFNLNFSENDFSYSYDASGNLKITTYKSASYPESNEPGLPLFSTDIAITGYKTYVSSSVRLSKHLIKSNVVVAQSPLPVITDMESDAGSIQKISYNNSAKYPSSNCKFTAISNWESIAILHFLSCPFVYDAAKKELYFIDSIELSITVEEKETTSSKKIRMPNLDIIKSVVSNNTIIDAIAEDNPVSDAFSNKIEYVIITTNALKSSYEPLLQWKKTKGLYSKIITIEEIESQYTGIDTPLKIKKCLYDLYLNNSLKYVLLGGDDTVVPTRGCYVTCSGYTDDSIPTDLYYACFGGNFEWDANGNGTYGETSDNIDMAQSIYVTRVPVRLPDEVNAFTAKLLAYEKDPIWSKDILMCGTKLWDYCPSQKSDAEEKGDNLYEHYIKPYWTGTRYKFYDTYTDFTGGASYDLTATNLSQQMGKGYAFLDISTHGSQTTWAMESGVSYNSTHGISQTNTRASIVTTMSCLTNAFDSSAKGGRQDPCLSESLIRNPLSGVIAYLGCSRYGWGLPGGTSNLGTSLRYESHFFKNLFSSTIKDKNYGIIVAAAKTAMVSSCSTNGSPRWVQFGLNPIGDPEMPIYIDTPAEFTAARIITSEAGSTIDTGTPNCKVCIMSEGDNGSSFYKVFENIQNISITNLPAKYSICITKQGYIPKQYSVASIQNETLTTSNTYNYNLVRIGSSVTTNKDAGPVVFKNCKTTINASKVIIEPITKIEKNVTFKINPN